MIKKNLKRFIPILLLLACSNEDYLPAGTDLIANPNISLSPGSPFPWVADQRDGIELGVSKEVFMTGNQSLFIANPDSLNSNSGSWSQKYTGPMPAPGDTLELKAFIKGEEIRNLTPGGNIGIFFRVYPSVSGNFEGRSAHSNTGLKHEGNFDWRLLTATLNGFPKDADYIQITLLMPSLTTGKVYFDEISLRIK